MSRYRPYTAIRRIVLHCADTPNGSIHTADDIDAWHAQRGFRRNAIGTPPGITNTAKVWCACRQHIGYHYVITPQGDVQAGRHLLETGAHVQGRNADSVGICLIGRDRYTHAQWGALSLLTDQIADLYLDDLTIVGHRDLNPAKSCPGFDVSAWLANGRRPLPGHILEIDPCAR